MEYKIHCTPYDTTVVVVFQNGEQVGMTNTDNPAFLAWCEEGNTPDEWVPAEATADKE